ncbi:MAG: NAD-binding protein [Thomasclavelia spiroformis]
MNADGSDEEVLLEEGLETTDAFLALTGLDEENLIYLVCKIFIKKDYCQVTR